MLCYEAPNDPKLPFDDTFLKLTWGTDRLVPVVAACLINNSGGDGALTKPIHVITFPENSFFARALSTTYYQNVVRDPLFETICESDFSGAIREMVLSGIALAWIPLSLVSADIEAGDLIDKSDLYGSATLKISLYARPESDLIKVIVHDLNLLRRTMP